MRNPKQRATEGLILLEEAVIAILSGQPGLEPNEISKLLGITKESYGYVGSDYPIVRSVLIKLERENRVMSDSFRPPRYKLIG